MKIETHTYPESTIEEFADEHGLVMEVRERNEIGNSHWYAHFKNVEVKGDGVLIGKFGNGATPGDAIANYAKEISDTTLVVGAYSEERRDIRVPRLRQQTNVSPVPIA